jgi:hypothetical protein
LITDLDFNFIKSVGSQGSENCQFNSKEGWIPSLEN